MKRSEGRRGTAGAEAVTVAAAADMDAARAAETRGTAGMEQEAAFTALTDFTGDALPYGGGIRSRTTVGRSCPSPGWRI